MTAKEFNEKWNFYLEEGHYGAEGFGDPKFLDWLDEKFETFVMFDNFSFSQIKSKFRMGRFYAKGIPEEQIREVEAKITELCKN